MNTFRLALIPNMMLYLCAIFCGLPGCAESAPKPSTTKSIHGSVSENELIDNLERLGIKCVYHQAAAKSYLAVDDVRMGSTAFYKGVAVGDKVKNLTGTNDLFTLTIEREGQTYQVALKALTPSLASASPLKSSVAHDDKNLPIPLVNVSQQNHQTPLVSVSQDKIPLLDVAEKKKKEAEKKLVQYDIELIIDITGSMQDKDGTGDQTKFQWCHEQVRNFAQLLGEYQKTFTITTFNTSFDTERQCNANRVEQIYATIVPRGGTDLVDPLMSRLNDSLENRRPGRATLIAVITDGMPNVPKDPRVVNRALVDFTQKMAKADDVVVTFLQIGDTFDGKSFCIDLDDNLVNEGAKFDIVDTKTFDDLKNEGLTSALVDAITEKRSVRRVTHHGPPSHLSSEDQAKVKNADAKLREKIDERQALEKILHIEKPQQ